MISNAALLAVVFGILVVVLLPAGSLGSPDGPIRSLSEHQSWGVHATLFAALGVVVGIRLAAPIPSLLTPVWLLVAVVAIGLLATVTELAQLQVEGRNAALGDWLADLSGTMFGLALAVGIAPTAITWLTGERGA